MPVPGFIEKWLMNPRTGFTHREIDELRGIYPSNLASGYYHYANSQVFTAVLSVPSGYRFILKRMVIGNEVDPNILRVYDGSIPNYTAIAYLPVAASEAHFIGKDDLGDGLVFESGVYVSNLTSYIHVRVSGLLIASTEW